MKFIYYPTKPYTVGQRFGDNKVCFKKTDNGTEYRSKRNDQTCSEFGSEWKSIYYNMKGHNGDDSPNRFGAEVRSPVNGIVMTVSDNDKALGVYVEIKTHANGEFYKIRLAHFMARAVELGDRVQIGDLVGFVGSTGNSTGSHLHLDVKRCDADGKTLDYDNGYFGAIDPQPFYTGRFARDIWEMRQGLLLKAIYIIRSWLKK